MTKLSWLIIFFYIVFGVLGTSSAGSINVINEFDSPGDHPEGLAWDGIHLWVVSYDTDIIYKVDSITFEIIQQFDSPDSEPGGLTYGDGYLWMGGNKNDKIYKINREDGNYTQIPGDYENPDGLAWQNGFLWVGLRDQTELAKINPNTGQIILALDIEGLPDGLTFDGSYLWYGEHINTEGTMNKIDPVSGEQLIQVDISTFADDVVGLTWDGMYFWISDNHKNKIFKINLGDQSGDYDSGYEAGRQACINNPSSCGISTGGGYTQADIDTAKQEGFDEGYQKGSEECDTSIPPIASDDTCAILENNFDITMPCIDVFGTKLSIGLENFIYTDDPFGYYWKLNLQ